MLVGAAGIALLLLWPALLGLSVTLMMLASVQMVLLYRLGQPVVETGSALVSFIENLDIECRRSVREFTPLTVMYLGAKTPLSASRAEQVQAVLQASVCRPGDQVAQLDDRTFAILLPVTNEQVHVLAERCAEKLKALSGNPPLALGVCTFQPQADLRPVYAMEKTATLLAQALDEGVMMRTEAEPLLDPSITFSH